MIRDEAVEAALAAWGGCPVGTSPKDQVNRILEAAAPIILSHEADRARLERIESPWGNR
jgi:hypothetical protein